jgi:hypothetical protein
VVVEEVQEVEQEDQVEMVVVEQVLLMETILEHQEQRTPVAVEVEGVIQILQQRLLLEGQVEKELLY